MKLSELTDPFGLGLTLTTELINGFREEILPTDLNKVDSL